ncbi:MAG: hypothetical protein QXQ46_00915, partial [Thermoplasmatales archaeon]
MPVMNKFKANASQIKGMRYVSGDEYKEFIQTHSFVEVEDTNVMLRKDWMIREYQPSEYIPEKWTVWSFPDRGRWATHIGD